VFQKYTSLSFKGAPLQNRDLHPITRKPKITRAGGPGLRARLGQRGKEDFSPLFARSEDRSARLLHPTTRKTKTARVGDPASQPSLTMLALANAKVVL